MWTTVFDFLPIEWAPRRRPTRWCETNIFWIFYCIRDFLVKTTDWIGRMLIHNVNDQTWEYILSTFWNIFFNFKYLFEYLYLIVFDKCIFKETVFHTFYWTTFCAWYFSMYFKYICFIWLIVFKIFVKYFFIN